MVNSPANKTPSALLAYFSLFSSVGTLFVVLCLRYWCSLDSALLSHPRFQHSLGLLRSTP
jgi:hypothetical protein